MSSKQFFSVSATHVFKPVLGELGEEGEEAEDGEPGHPGNHLLQGLNIHHPEDKNKLVEQEVPKLVLQVLKNKSHFS
jgi:hypothetical protein